MKLLFRAEGSSRGRKAPPPGSPMAVTVAFGLLWACYPLHGQVLSIESADSVDGRPRSSLSLGGWLKLHGIYDFSGTPYTWALSPPSIPTGDVERDPQFHLDMYQSRLKLTSHHRPDGFPMLTAYVEMDFFGGGGGGLRMRHAFLTVGGEPSNHGVLVGHTWTTFADPDAWPNMTDFDGPPTGVWVRQGQLRYEWFMGRSGRLQIALETPETDFDRSLQVDSTLAEVNQHVPEFAANYRWTWAGGHLQAGGIVRNVRYYNDRVREKSYFTGWGINLSGVARVTSGGDLVTFQVLGGEGVSRYMVGFSGLGLDAIPDRDGFLQAAPTLGGYLGYQHFWSARWSSTAVGGYALITNDVLEGVGDLYQGGYWSVNLYWHPIPMLSLGAELLFGTNTEPTLQEPEGAYGDGGRFQFVMEFAF